VPSVRTLGESASQSVPTGSTAKVSSGEIFIESHGLEYQSKLLDPFVNSGSVKSQAGRCLRKIFTAQKYANMSKFLRESINSSLEIDHAVEMLHECMGGATRSSAVIQVTKHGLTGRRFVTGLILNFAEGFRHTVVALFRGLTRDHCPRC